ncbi:MAG: hypothetical protein IKV54_05420 [Clostridia bacterium]|nr:hypothetical protein [Clostridia bacterium]
MAGRVQCEDCEHYDYDEFTDSYECNVSLDEDEYEKYVSRRVKSCPYYRHYDEYKMVRKQN